MRVCYAFALVSCLNLGALTVAIAMVILIKLDVQEFIPEAKLVA